MNKFGYILLGAIFTGLVIVTLHQTGTHRPAAVSAMSGEHGSDMPIELNAASSQMDNEPVVETATQASLEQWRAYQAGKIPFEQLSNDNQERVNRSKYLQWEQEDKARRERIQAMDIAAGRNAAVREREAELHTLAQKLYKGIPQAQYVSVLGRPSSTRSITNFLPTQRIEGGDSVLVYSPHPSGKISYSMGDSFQYLEVWLNTNSNTIVGWRWRTPGLVSKYYY